MGGPDAGVGTIGRVFRLFGRRRNGAELRVRSRSESVHAARPSTVRIDFLAPDARTLVGSMAYFKLAAFGYLTAALPLVEDPEARARVAALAETLLARHRRYLDAFHRAADGEDTAPFAGDVVRQAASDELWGRLTPNLWQEAVLAVHLVDGIAVDFLARLGHGARLGGGLHWPLLDRPDDSPAVTVLLAEMERDDTLPDRLSMWGRRVVGDALLWCRALMVLDEPVLRALRDSTLERDDEVQRMVSQIEAVHTDLIAEHTTRMERLGLTA